MAERLKLAREDLELTQEQVARWLGIRRPAVAEIEGGSRSVKSDELVRLAALYGRSLTWLVEGEMGTEEKIQAALFRAGDHADPALHREVAKLARRCRVVFEIEKKLRSGARTSHRMSHVPQYGDDGALEDRSNALEHGKEVAYQERARLGIGESAPLRDPWGVVEDAGIRVFSLNLGDDHPIDGIFARGEKGQACVGVNIDKWVFRQVFTVVHEYGHALMDSDVTGETCATSAAWKGKGSRSANRELRANQFAAVFLVPREALLWFLDSRGKLGRGTLDLLWDNPRYERYLTPIVRSELMSEPTRSAISKALVRGDVQSTELDTDSAEELKLLSRWSEIVDPGEAEAIAIALRRGWVIGLEDRFAQRRATEVAGDDRWINSATVFIHAVNRCSSAASRSPFRALHAPCASTKLCPRSVG